MLLNGRKAGPHRRQVGQAQLAQASSVLHSALTTATVFSLPCCLQPYLAPPYPWADHYNGREECFSRVDKWGSRPSWLKPADAIERCALRQWLFAVRRGLNQKQMQAYKVCCNSQLGGNSWHHAAAAALPSSVPAAGRLTVDVSNSTGWPAHVSPPLP